MLVALKQRPSYCERLLELLPQEVMNDEEYTLIFDKLKGSENFDELTEREAKQLIKEVVSPIAYSKTSYRDEELVNLCMEIKNWAIWEI